MSKQTILVTGGAGFIGSHVVDAFIEKGHQVIVLDDLSSGNADFLNSEAIFIEADVRSAQIEEIFKDHKPDVICHHASQIDVRKSVDDPIYDADVNIRGALNLLELAVAYGVKKIIFSSTGGAIYGAPTDLPADENCVPKPECPYGTSKLCVEQYIKLYSRMYDLAYTILRYPNVYGPRQSPDGEAGVCSILTGLMLDGKTPTLYGKGKAFRDYVYVADIAAANLLALSKGSGETVNLGSETPVTVKELYTHLAKLTGYKGKASLKPLRRGEVEGIYITGGHARSVLGWKPEVSLAEGLEKTVAYIREQRKEAAHPEA